MNHLAIVRILSAIVLGFSALFFGACCAPATGEREQLMVFAGTAFASRIG